MRNLVANALEADLSDWLNENRPWNEIATEFITAHGDVREVGGTAIMMAQDGQTEEIAAEVSRIFLGVQIQCAQCHDHPYDRWKREAVPRTGGVLPAHGRAAGARSHQAEFRSGGAGSFRPQPPRQQCRKAPTAEHLMPDLEDPQAPGTQMEAEVLPHQRDACPGARPTNSARMQLAEWLTENEWFATAVVNRLWAELVGEGFYHADRRHRPRSRTDGSRGGRSCLTDEFRESGYDVKWLIATICQTEAYQRESRPRRELATRPSPRTCRSGCGAISCTTRCSRRSIIERAAAAAAGRCCVAMQGTPRGQFGDVFGYDPSVPREEAVSVDSAGAGDDELGPGESVGASAIERNALRDIAGNDSQRR